MVYKIKKGHHNNSNFTLPKLFLGRREHEIEVMFDQTCVYDLHDYNQHDINKLWGYSFGHHHRNSFRIGWNYDLVHQMIKISAYWYNDLKRGYHPISYIRINETGKIRVVNDYKQGYIIVTDMSNPNLSHTIPFDFPFFKIGYYLDVWFGGDMVAPHDMSVLLKT